jgi:hypothetical protein
VIAAGVTCLGAPPRVPAQPPAADTLAARGTISGTVVEAESGTPVPGARVIAYPDPPAVMPPVGASPFLVASRATVTGPEGEYRLVGLPPGRYGLRVQRLGFRPVSLTVELRGAADARVGVGLDVVPVRLQPVDVSSSLVEPYGRTTPAAHAAVRRVAVARLRQRRHLATDVQALTRDDVEEAVTFAESDLFRALHRLPGVATRDAYTAELRVRGAPGDQTRVLFDGLPLHNALHAFGGLSGVNTDALGAAVLHPGVAPASLGGGGAAVLDLRSRRGGVRGPALTARTARSGSSRCSAPAPRWTARCSAGAAPGSSRGVAAIASRCPRARTRRTCSRTRSTTWPAAWTSRPAATGWWS